MASTSSTSSPAHKHKRRTILDPVSDALTKIPQYSYDVFLCHRGPDTKATLVEFLQDSLESKGITCFVDVQMDNGVDFPPALNQAIHKSKVHIIVLSPRFAQSSWCLDEVELIMKLQETSKGSYLVLPIFSNVDPADVRLQRPGSVYDLPELHKRCTKVKIDRWSQALVDLGYIKGFIWDNDRSQELIEEILHTVHKFLLDCLPPYAEPSWASGYATQIEKAAQMLCLHNDDNVVSIGVRGTNKSKFARVLYDTFRQHFQASCILLDVEGKAQDLVKLQMTLLEQLQLVKVGNISPRILDPVQGRALLLDRLKHVKCFLVLDGIEDDEEQLRSLLVLDQDQLSGGSRLVLTSHYPHVLVKRARVKETIHLQHQDEVEEPGKRLAICWERSNDVHEGFILQLGESLAMLGLDVSEMEGVDLLNADRVKQADIILVILSQSFVDSPTCMERLDKAHGSCSGFKFVCISYGLQPERIALIAKTTLEFPVDFHDKSRLDMMAFKSLINDIVLNQMEHKYEMDVTKFPVDLRKRREELESQICGSLSDRKKVSTFGILGMGGIGKTTLAKSLYNRICKKFEGAVFLPDVRTKAKQHDGLVSLQRDLAEVLNKDLGSIKNVEKCKALLTCKLRGTHILAILDDVDHISQLDALLKPLDLGPGSVVVITTRDRSILEAAGVNHPYEMEYLNQENGKMLFYWHAFLKPFPPKDLEIIAQKVIDACGGLPLSLEVIGAHVYNNNDPEFWKDTLVHLSKAGNDIFEKLRVSVDSLERYQQEAFLDVCCFLIGEPCQTALRIWEGCGWAAPTCVKVLKNKCLITVDPTDSTIGMHDQIRDMGRYIADGRTPKTHIWDAKDSSDIPEGGIDDLRGFATTSEFGSPRVRFEASDLARVRRSKVLLLRKVEIRGDFSRLRFDRIRWLQWPYGPFVNLPPGLYCSRQLRVLDLSRCSYLETLWGSSQSGNMEVPESLQELHLSECFRLRELPQFDVYLQNLQWLDLSYCTSIKHLHDSIGSLKKLKFLDLSLCESLESLPDTIQGLLSLEKLNLFDCKSLQSLPEGIGRCHNLIEIVLAKTAVKYLPESFGKLTNLEKLCLGGDMLVALPDSLGLLNMLRKFDLYHCTSLKQWLRLSNLRSLPDTIEGCLRSLKVLDLSHCLRLESLPEDIGRCRNLIEINLESCRQLVALPDSLGALNGLVRLCLKCCSRLRSLPNTIEGLLSLEKLDLSFCESLESLPEGIGRCFNLIETNLAGIGLTNLPESFGELSKLEELDVRPPGCFDLQDDSMWRLGKPAWRGTCKSLQQLPQKFCELTSLIRLDLSYCDLGNLPGRIGDLHKLIVFSLRNNGRLRRLPASMSDLRSLTRLDLRGCPLEDEGLLGELLDVLESLQEMKIAGAEIGSLDVGNNGQGTSSLTILSVTDCCNLERVSGLDRLKRLERLELRGCDKLRYLNGLEGLEGLEELDISLCRALQNSSRVINYALGSEALRRLYIGHDESSVPSMQLLQIPNLELLSWYGWELHGGFRKWDKIWEEMGYMEIPIHHGATVLVSVVIPAGLFVRYFVNRWIVDEPKLIVELCCTKCSDSPTELNQVILLILRTESKILENPPKDCYNTLSLRIPSPLRIASYKVVWGGLEEFSAKAGWIERRYFTTLFDRKYGGKHPSRRKEGCLQFTVKRRRTRRYCSFDEEGWPTSSWARKVLVQARSNQDSPYQRRAPAQ